MKNVSVYTFFSKMFGVLHLAESTRNWCVVASVKHQRKIIEPWLKSRSFAIKIEVFSEDIPVPHVSSV